MKHLMIFLMLVTCIYSYGQKFQLDLGLGYGFGLTSTHFPVNQFSSNWDTGEYESKYFNQRYDYNEGLIGHLKLNYFLNDQMFLVLGGRYGSGTRNYGTIIYETTGSFSQGQEEDIEEKYIQTDVQIGLGLSRQISEKLSLNFSHGFTFFVFGKLTENSETQVFGAAPLYVSRSITTEYSPYFTFGAYGDVGLLYNLSNHLDLFFNMTLQAKNWSSKKSTIKELKIDGVDLVPLMSTYEIETEYDSSTEYSSQSVNSEAPRKFQRTWAPNSGIEGVLGIRYKFGSEIKKMDSSANQNGIYIQLAGGFGTPISELTNISSESTYDYSSNEEFFKSDTELYSYGTGVYGQVLAGYQFRNGIAIELAGLYNKSTRAYSIMNTNLFDGDKTDEIISETRNDASMVRTSFGMKMETQNTKFNTYVRTGITLGFASIRESISTQQIDFSGGTTTVTEVEQEYLYSKNPSFGGYIGIGEVYNFNKRLALMVEAVTYLQNWSPGRREYTVYSVDGMDQLANMATNETLVEYENSFSFSSAQTTVANEAAKALKFSEPFSTFMVTLGVRINFGKF